MVTTCVLFMNVSFTRYSKKYPRPMLSASGSLRIRYTSIRIRNRSNLNHYLYRDYPCLNPNLIENVKTNTISVISVRIRSVYIPTRHACHEVHSILVCSNATIKGASCKSATKPQLSSNRTN